MRRILQTIGSCIIVATLMFTVVTLSKGADSHANGTTYATPTPASTLPSCVTEDGAGMALCWWDAQTQGNGKGTSVVSGDCADMGEDTSLCVNVYARDSNEVDNKDGSYHTVPNGADIVGECMSIMQKGRMDKEAKAILNSEGWTIRECLSSY